ncbi:serine/threonine-protein kinase [Streptomyces sp900105755]|uniref:serine/threonine-protein kinase n=1 Tax=Streptomyces sp. 900105755 TaxID=3154389 RepID=UPI00331CFEC4
MEPLDTNTDPQVVGPFELLARLGTGGMGVAYLARRIPLDVLSEELAAAYNLVEPDDVESDESGLVVVKVVQPDLLDGDPQARERFGREIDAVRAVVSDRVPALIAFEEDPAAAQPWFAMDYIAGPSLHTLVKEASPLAVGPCAALGLFLVDALRAIHSTGLLHRDLKPRNVVLGPAGPVVLDFGLAVLIERRTSQALTEPGKPWGTWPYASYEQLHDPSKAKEPSDVYALGATLFFALTRRPPFAQQPLLTPPDWTGVPAEFLPLLGQILVATAGQRPDLDGVDMGLRAVLVQAGLTPELAAQQLRAAVAAADLAPKLPPGVLVDPVDPAVQEQAQQAIDVDLPDFGPDFYGIVDTDEIEYAVAAADDQQAEAAHEDGPDARSATPAAPAPADPGPVSPTSHPLPPPRPSEKAAERPSAALATPPRAARNVAARLRKRYAHSGNL